MAIRGSRPCLAVPLHLAAQPRVPKIESAEGPPPRPDIYVKKKKEYCSIHSLYPHVKCYYQYF